jgi:hypothetical protein
VPSFFAQPYMYWVGADIDTDDPDEIEAFNAFYSGTHVPEVVAANPGFTNGHRYELLQPDARGVPAPRFLAVYEMAHEGAARTYSARNDGPPEGRPRYTPGPPVWDKMSLQWRLIWRSFARTAEPEGTPEQIFLVGMSPPATAGPAELAEFNDFYTNIHLPEVVERGGYGRGIRLELYRDLLHPAPGAPRYCALYETEKEASGVLPTSATTPGPAVWDQRVVPWRLVYRRLPG